MISIDVVTLAVKLGYRRSKKFVLFPRAVRTRKMFERHFFLLLSDVGQSFCQLSASDHAVHSACMPISTQERLAVMLLTLAFESSQGISASCKHLRI